MFDGSGQLIVFFNGLSWYLSSFSRILLSMDTQQLKFLVFHKLNDLGFVKLTFFEIALICGLIYYAGFVNVVVLLQLVPLVIAVVLHEVAHAYVANTFGDPTAKNLGRITLNPLPHVDPLGTVLLPMILIFTGSGFLIAWAKPVPVNPNYFKEPVKEMMWVALAGPLTNFSIAIVCSILYKVLLPFFSGADTANWVIYSRYFLQYSVLINLVLGIFNLFPIPPLDGSKILTYFLPIRLRPIIYRLENYGMLLIFLFAFLGFFGSVLSVVIPPLLRVLL